MRRIVAAAAIAALSLVAAGCGGTDADSSVEAAAGSGEVIDASVFSGTATTISGESFDLGTLADKDLVVWFWAPW
ncbi:MAG: hypothetical protein ACRBK7_21005 [Acidimicrobiales bacterium]